MSSGKRFACSLLVILSATQLHSCGYRLIGQATGLPDEIAKISVEVFRNKTYEPNLEAYVTKGILEAITVDGRLKVVPSDEADAIITGEIISYSTVATAYNSSRTATSYKNSLSVRFEFTDRHGMNIQYEGTVSTTGNYSTTSNLQSIEASRLTSIIAMGKSVGTSITSTLLNRFSLEPLLYGNTYGLTLADKNRLKHLYSWKPAGKEVFGNSADLTENARREIETLYLARSAPENPASKKLLYRLVDYSKKMGKDIALLIDRGGNVTHIIVDSDKVPDFRRMEIGKNRLSGIKLVRSNLSGGKLTKADLENLLTRRLDMVIAVNERKEKIGMNSDDLEIRLAYLTGDDNKPFIVYGPESYNNAVSVYNRFREKVAGSINRAVYGNTKELSQKHIELVQTLYTERVVAVDTTELPKSDIKEKHKEVAEEVEDTPDGEPIPEPPPKRRSIPTGSIVTKTLLEDMVEISKIINRPVSLLIDKGGAVTDVIVNRKRGVSIPDDRSYESKNLEGFRFIRASGDGGEITSSDLALLDTHRLDFVGIAVPEKKGIKVSLAFKTKDEGGPYAVYAPASPKRTVKLMSKFKTDRAKETATYKPAEKELLEYMARISGELKREVAVLVTRSGRVTHVAVGDERNISIPPLPKTRIGLLKLNGVSFIRTGFKGEGITGDDLEALIGSRFDSVIVAGVRENGTLGGVALAHLTTSNPESPFAVYTAEKYEEMVDSFQLTAGEIRGPSIDISLKGLASGLGEREKKLLQSLYFSSIQEGTIGDEEILMRRKIGKNELISQRLLADLARISSLVKRETGVMINREGEIEAVVVGDEMQMVYPPPAKRSIGKKKLSGLRFIHTQFGETGIADSGDLYDLLLQRFDMIAVVAVEQDGTVGRIGVALLTGDDDKPFTVHDPVVLDEANKIFAAFFESVKNEPEKTPLYGDFSRISHDDIESLKNLYFEKIDPAKPVTARLLSEISGLSNRNGRGIGIIFDRDGRVTHVLLGAGDGTEQPLPIPALPYRRTGKLKLNGFTLIHFRPDSKYVSKDDLAELAFQRLDAVISVEVKPNGKPGKSSLAYLTDNRKKLYVGKPSTPDKITDRYNSFIRQQ